MAKAKFDVCEEVTNQIIEAIESGTPPWRKPWTGDAGGTCFPMRSTGQYYQGINVLLLWLKAEKQGFASAHWFTFRQAKEKRGQVRKGEKSTTVVYYGTLDREDDKGDEKKVPYLKAYRVFNADQIDDLPSEFYRKPEPARDLGTKPNAELDTFFAATGATLTSSDEPQAYYNRMTDSIHMPPIPTFHSANGFYETLAHEHCHWTGASNRLDRFKDHTERKDYAFEELIAEIGSCMLCAQIGVVPEIDQSAAYIEGWLKALKNDKRLYSRQHRRPRKQRIICLKRRKPNSRRWRHERPAKQDAYDLRCLRFNRCARRCLCRVGRRRRAMGFELHL